MDYPAKPKKKETYKLGSSCRAFELRSLDAAKTARCYAIALLAVDKGLTKNDPDAVLERLKELKSLKDDSLNEVEKLITDYPFPPKLSKSFERTLEILKHEAT